jgi:hypothetical protein
LAVKILKVQQVAEPLLRQMLNLVMQDKLPQPENLKYHRAQALR